MAVTGGWSVRLASAVGEGRVGVALCVALSVAEADCSSDVVWEAMGEGECVGDAAVLLRDAGCRSEAVADPRGETVAVLLARVCDADAVTSALGDSVTVADGTFVGEPRLRDALADAASVAE